MRFGIVAIGCRLSKATTSDPATIVAGSTAGRECASTIGPTAALAARAPNEWALIKSA